MANDEAVYQVVAARRLQWDQQVWQVPVLSLTAQAFLFTISLGSGSSQTSRIIAAVLSLITSLLSIELMSRHRQAEIVDARWLSSYEKNNFPNQDPPPSDENPYFINEHYVVHGIAFRDYRKSTPAGPLGHLPGYWTWLSGLALFGVAALVVLGLAIFYPSTFT